MEDNQIIQMGASLYGLINIISRAEYEEFTQKQDENIQSDFVKNLNSN